MLFAFLTIIEILANKITIAKTSIIKIPLDTLKLETVNMTSGNAGTKYLRVK